MAAYDLGHPDRELCLRGLPDRVVAEILYGLQARTEAGIRIDLPRRRGKRPGSAVQPYVTAMNLLSESLRLQREDGGNHRG
ncbi:hypothetical protein ACFYWX_25410 [Streptomyces sp. NPDC002888]|uniref:hypothetical protein n=1 Tax=Streptomyces sp. NPDC002888 TaxID=3364668 RepID=UPI00367A62FF